jgi:beta-ketodecanoyl-[acyl-carrier-protein] synthase
MAEVSVKAARQALERAGRDPGDVDAVICSCSSLQRPYPALAIEVQNALGAGGFGYDMNVACSSATFAIQNAADIVRAGHARSALVVNPELCTGHLNYRDRETHFIFGDAAVAVLVERAEIAPKGAWAILGTKLQTRFSNNIRNNFGFLNRCDPQWRDMPDKLITQQGRKVFKEVVPLVSEMILQHMAELGLKPSDMRRFWLHQANSNMNRLIADRVLGHEASQDESPTVLDVYGNTAGAEGPDLLLRRGLFRRLHLRAESGLSAPTRPLASRSRRPRSARRRTAPGTRAVSAACIRNCGRDR